MYNWVEQGLFILQWLGVLIILHLSFWVGIRRWIPEYAYPISYPASLLLFGVVSWWLGIVHLPVWMAILPFLILFAYYIGKKQVPFSEIQKEVKWDLLFLLFFFAVLITRLKNSAIFANERFLDMGIVASIMRNPVVPPLDPQFSGGYLDLYYYFSHWIYASLGIVCQVPPSVVYNLILPTTVGLAAVSCYGIGKIITPGFPFLPLLLLVIPRPSLIIGMLTGGWIDFTKAIEESVQIVSGTGHTYPYYDILWGIPHPYVNALFLQIFLLFMILLILVKWDSLGITGRRVVLLFTGISAGLMVPVNSWDALVYYPLMVGIVVYLVIRIYQGEKCAGTEQYFIKNPDLHSLFLMIIAGCGILLPYLFQADMGGITGIGFVADSSDIVPYLLVHGWFILIFYLYLLPEIFNKPYLILPGLIPGLFGYWSGVLLLIPVIYLVSKEKYTVFDCMAGYGLSILFLTEFFYLQEILDPISRFNTVFKLNSALWPLLWIAVFGMLTTLFGKIRHFSMIPDPLRQITGTLFIIILCIVLVFAPIEPFFNIISIDGGAYLEVKQPDDAKVIALLSSDRSATGIVEAAGDFDYHTRIASFSGVPAVIGWPSIESQWGRNVTEINRRIHDVESVYKNQESAHIIMNRYNVSHLMIGRLEEVKYGKQVIGTTRLNEQYAGNTTRLYQMIS